MGKRGLFGGSFDPVHLGHLWIAERSREVCGLDCVHFLPCSCSPLKEVCPAVADEDRVRMLELAVGEFPWAVVDRKDLEWPPPSWSWRLAEYFKGEFPDDELYWIMGADQWRDLEAWGRWQYLAEMVVFVVHHRGGEVPVRREGVRSVFIEGNHLASSSLIRGDVRGNRGYLPEAVFAYIVSRGLYGSGN